MSERGERRPAANTLRVTDCGTDPLALYREQGR
jgi:hypothetical protein